MSGAEEVRFSLNLMINKEKSKVLFASVDRAFADVLLSLLTLPIGRILSLLNKHCGDEALAIGSLNTLYTGLQKLDGIYFWTKSGKQMLLDPRTSVEDEYPKLKLNVYGFQPTKYFTCPCLRPTFSTSLFSEDVSCSNCGKLMKSKTRVAPVTGTKESDEVFAQQHASFLLSDDLHMMSNATGSILQTLASFGIMDVDGAEYNTVSVGFNEIIDLLRGSLLSKTPLTDVFLHERHMHQSSIVKSEPSPVLPVPEEKKEEKCMKIKATMQKSQNKVLFAQAKDDFVDFLFSFLTIPLGQVESLLSMNSSLGCIDNLYRSVASSDGDNWLMQQKKDILLEPKLPIQYLSKHQIFSLKCAEQAELYCNKASYGELISWTRTSQQVTSSTPGSFVDPKGQGSYVRSNSMFTVTDDLTVTPHCMLSSLSFLKGLSVPLSDIEEVEINIGLEEGLNILKASLTSSSALTNGLKLSGTAMPKQPKHEKL